MKPYSGAEV